MIKTIAAWIGLGLALAILTTVLDVPIWARLSVAAVYGTVSFPVIYLRHMTIRGRADRSRS